MMTIDAGIHHRTPGTTAARRAGIQKPTGWMLQALRPCRWHDQYPQLTFWVELLQLMPDDYQQAISKSFNHFLAARLPKRFEPGQGGHRYIDGMNRWYDRHRPLAGALENLRLAPKPIRQQAAHFLIHQIERAAEGQALLFLSPESADPPLADLTDLANCADTDMAAHATPPTLVEQHEAYVDGWLEAFMENHIEISLRAEAKAG
ncbi:MAG: hypothetical protein R2857_00320 [Vampirovibrionales bacterium]|nr:hypothetical protein [Cyanobacteria bacterium HKST-UBA03]